MTEQQKVWVGIYSHRHGDDVGIYATEELVKTARQNIAEEWWDHEMPADQEKPDDPEERADAYFNFCGYNESFTIEECEIKGAPAAPQPADATLLAIQELMDGTEWSADTLEAIAGIMVEAGYRIRDRNDVDRAKAEG